MPLWKMQIGARPEGFVLDEQHMAVCTSCKQQTRTYQPSRGEGLHVGITKQLFVDKYLIQRLRHVAQVPLEATKGPRPVLSRDKPWEATLFFASYCTVRHNGSQFVMLYVRFRLVLDLALTPPVLAEALVHSLGPGQLQGWLHLCETPSGVHELVRGAPGQHRSCGLCKSVCRGQRRRPMHSARKGRGFTRTAQNPCST